MSEITDKSAACSATRYKRTAAWYTIAVLLIAYVFSFIDRQILSFLIVPIQEDLNVNDTQMGILHGLTFAIFYAVMGIPVARLLDRGNRKVIISIAVGLWSLMTALSGLSTRYLHLLFARIFIAIGESALVPGTNSLVPDIFPSEKRGLAMGVFSSGMYLGVGLAFIAGGALVGALQGVHVTLPFIGPIKPWQLTFIIVGMPGILVALLCLTILEPMSSDRQTKKGASISEIFSYIKSNGKSYFYLWTAIAFMTFMGQAIIVWTPTYFIRIHEWSYTTIGFVLGLVFLIACSTGTVVGGWIADRWVRKGFINGPIRVGLLAAIGFGLPGALFPLIGNAAFAVAIAVFAFFFSAFVWGPAAAAIQEMTPAPMRAQVTACYAGYINLLGLGFGPVSVGVLNDYVFRDPQMIHYSISIVAAIGAVGATGFFLLSLGQFEKTIRAADEWTAQRQ